MSIDFINEFPPRRRFEWTRAAVSWADEIGPKVRTRLKEEAPVAESSQWNKHAGRLRDSIRYQRETHSPDVDLYFRAHVPYAKWVIDGTRPHEIRAKAARSLRWMWYGHAPGGIAFAKKVSHPGTKANPFNVRAMESMRDEVQQRFTEIMQEAMGWPA